MNTDYVTPPPARKTAWGFWATVGLSLAIKAAFLILQMIVAVPFAVVALKNSPGIDREAIAEALKSNGLLLSIATCIAAPTCIGLTLLLAKLSKRSSVKQYLALNRTSAKTAFAWMAALVLFVACSDGLTFLLGRPLVPEFMKNIYETASCLPLLWIAIVLVAPAFEEIFYRGFLFKGIEESKLGPIGAILITALVWAIIHVQYDAYQIGTIFAGGILLGIARWKTKSVYVAIGMHSLQNLIAMIEAATVV